MATLVVRNSEGAEFKFERKTPSVTRSSVRVALDALTFFINSERAYVQLARGQVFTQVLQARRRDGTLFWERSSGRAIDPADQGYFRTNFEKFVGKTLEEAYWKTEILDAYCRILLLSKQLGHVEYLGEKQSRELLDLKKKLGFDDPRFHVENCDLCGNSALQIGRAHV